MTTRPHVRRAVKPSKAVQHEPVALRIARIGADGDGVGALPDGTRYYVPLTVPGDVVLVRPFARRGEGWAAAVETLLERGPSRQTPACIHFGTCGGCALQHWDEPAYRDWKTGLLTAALHRAGYDDPTVDPIAGAGPHSRRRMDLAVRRTASTAIVGLHQPRSAEIVDIAQCPVLHPALFALIAPLRIVFNRLNGLRREASLVVNLLDSGPDLLLRTDNDLTTPDRTLLTAFAREHGLPRISWARNDESPETVCLLAPPTTAMSGVSVMPPPGAFLQATAAGEAAIVSAVLAGLPKKRTARAQVLELYAGCGTIGFALAAHMRVTAFEGDPALVSACHTAANMAGLMGKVTISARDLARQPLQAKELKPFAAMVLDPPHAGAAAQMPHIAMAKVPVVIYVSCDPGALGRDALVLHDAGYRLERATPIDQFLWSARLESVSVFRFGSK